MRIIDREGDRSEDLALNGSLDHRNPFGRGQTDQFDVGSSRLLNGIDQIELWTDGKGLGHGWFPDYIQVTDNKTGDVACFPIHQYLNQKQGGIVGKPLRLKRLADDRSCDEWIEENDGDKDDDDDDKETEDQIQSSGGKVDRPPTVFKNTFSVATKMSPTAGLELGHNGPSG